MNLYKLFNDVIIEESKKQIRLITEGVDIDNVRSAIDNMYMVNVMYRPEEDNVLSKRYVAVYNLGKTKAGNDAIRVYQVSGGNRKTHDWKTFRLDRIEGWKPTKMRWYNPISDYDSSIPTYQINRDKTFSVLNKSVDPAKFGNPREVPQKAPTNNVSQATTQPQDVEDRPDMVKIPEPEPDDDFIPEPKTTQPNNNQQKPEPKVKVPTSITPKKVKTEIPKDKEEDEQDYEVEDDENNENN